MLHARNSRQLAAAYETFYADQSYLGRLGDIMIRAASRRAPVIPIRHAARDLLLFLVCVAQAVACLPSLS